MENKTLEVEVWAAMVDLWRKMKATKPTERTEQARRYAVTMTEFEKVMGYFNTFVLEGYEAGED